MNDEDLRDLFAGLAMVGLIKHFDFDTYRQDPKRVARWAYDAADALLEAKHEVVEVGIKAAKPRRKKADV